MKRQVNNTRKCIECGVPVPRKVKRCSPCYSVFRKIRKPYARTPEHKKKMSERLKGMKKHNRPSSCQPEVAEKIRSWWTPERREAARLRGLAFAQDPEWRLKIALSVSGCKNPMWENGRSRKPYSPGFSDKLREIVKLRDGEHCKECGSSDNLCVHHIDFEKDNHSLDNLELLCRKCHKMAHAEHLHVQTT